MLPKSLKSKVFLPVSKLDFHLDNFSNCFLPYLNIFAHSFEKSRVHYAENQHLT